MILLDTNVLSELMRSTPAAAVVEWVDEQPGSRLFICAITRAEIELGIALLVHGKRRERLARTAVRMFDEFPDRCLPFDDTAATHYAVLVAHRTRLGRPISVENARIAAIALSTGLALATRNLDDFDAIDDLNTINPWHP